MKIGESKAAAEEEAEDLTISVGMNEGLYTSGRLVLTQVNEILKSLNQDISIIKKEYESINQIR